MICGVNTLFNGLLNTPGFDQVDFKMLKLTVGGGTQVQKSVAERWKEVTGGHIIEAYGLTECSPGVAANPMNTPWNALSASRSRLLWFLSAVKDSRTSASGRLRRKFRNTPAKSA